MEPVKARRNAARRHLESLIGEAAAIASAVHAAAALDELDAVGQEEAKRRSLR